MLQLKGNVRQPYQISHNNKWYSPHTKFVLFLEKLNTKTSIPRQGLPWGHLPSRSSATDVWSPACQPHTEALLNGLHQVCISEVKHQQEAKGRRCESGAPCLMSVEVALVEVLPTGLPSTPRKGVCPGREKRIRRWKVSDNNLLMFLVHRFSLSLHLCDSPELGWPDVPF